MKYAWVMAILAVAISACCNESSEKVEPVGDTVEVFIVPEGRVKISSKIAEQVDIQTMDTIDNSMTE